LSVLHLPLLEHSTLTSLVYELQCTHVCEQNKTLSKVNYSVNTIGLMTQGAFQHQDEL